jgi:hypothetical protein
LTSDFAGTKPEVQLERAKAPAQAGGVHRLMSGAGTWMSPTLVLISRSNWSLRAWFSVKYFTIEFTLATDGNALILSSNSWACESEPQCSRPKEVIAIPTASVSPPG